MTVRRWLGITTPIWCIWSDAPRHHGWQVSLDSNGLPTFGPPPWIDPERKPRQHHRYQLRHSSLNPIGQDPPHPADHDNPVHP